MRAGRAWWPRHARRFVRRCAVVERLSRAPRCAKIAHGGRCVAPMLGAVSRLEAGRCCKSLAQSLRNLLTIACATRWRIVRHAPHALRRACGRAPHATWWRRLPPRGLRPAVLRRCRDG
ncbi:hypothetical protein F511_45643 [Dorcoceras hygrometricum]|uniref:Uncharacterized protein n=1 Tax=Dorcoceras hygrometricum TaxID=472368 RepID=A0A2Z6ZWM5_9LAMI|nr:hypothetical protein F511_45643 [Dorcoceras hygrometricum]